MAVHGRAGAGEPPLAAPLLAAGPLSTLACACFFSQGAIRHMCCTRAVLPMNLEPLDRFLRWSLAQGGTSRIRRPCDRSHSSMVRGGTSDITTLAAS